MRTCSWIALILASGSSVKTLIIGLTFHDAAKGGLRSGRFLGILTQA
jgi:hypothetical protein